MYRNCCFVSMVVIVVNGQIAVGIKDMRKAVQDYNDN